MDLIWLYGALFEIYSYVDRKNTRLWILEDMAYSGDGKKESSLYRVFSDHLDPNKCWYALNSSLCASKPSQFCSTASALEFPEEYKFVTLGDLRAKDGSQVPSRWFCSTRNMQKVYVATTFGVLLGILRLKSWASCQFVYSEQFQSVVRDLNARGLESASACTVSNVVAFSKLTTAENRQIGCRQKINFDDSFTGPVKHPCVSQKNDQESPPTESPPTESPPNKSPPNEGPRKLKRTICQLKADKELSPPVKRRKIREQAVSMMKSIYHLCERNGESLHTVLAECCLMTGDDGHRAQDSVKATIDAVVEEKGVRKGFSKLISEETWDKRIQSMRVPDWMYLLFKLKARISDSAWQDFTNLTKLGRTGVSL